MASKTAILSVRIISDAKKAVAGFKEATGGLDKLESGLKKVQPAATVAAGAVIALGKQAVDSASALEQSTGAVESVFKAQATAIKDLAADAAGAVGLSANQYQEFASVIGSQLKNLGTAQEDLVPTTDKLITMGADLASMFGGTTADAVESLSAAFRGEYDPVEKYGISIKKSDINARLAAKGLSGLEGEALRQAEAQELLAMLTEQSADAMGNFQRETDTAAGSAQIAAANWENAKAALGQSLLPVVTQVAEKLAGLAQVVGQHPQLFGAAALAIVGVAGAINGALLAIKAFHAAQTIIASVKAAWVALNTSMAVTRATMVAGNAAAAAQSAAAWVASAARMAVAWTVSTARMVAQLAIQRGAMLAARAATLAMAAGQAILNAVMTANPIGIVIVAISALVAGLVLAYNKSETFRNAVQTAARASKAAFDVVVNVIRAVIAAIGNMISRVGGVGGAFRGAMNIAAAAVRILTAPIHGLISLIQSVIGWISRIRFPSPPGWMRKLTGSAMSFSAGGGAMLTAAGPASFSPLGGVLAPAASGPANVDARTIINVNITDSAVGDERHLADVVTRAIRKTDVQLGRKKVFK
ncbi:TPA: hypothetical protein I8W09_001424 [Corynebacterium striatum]|nr:hypothetical protein [Corynebacterium striatum]